MSQHVPKQAITRRGVLAGLGALGLTAYSTSTPARAADSGGAAEVDTLTSHASLASVTPADPPVPTGYVLDWSDEFDGSALDTSQWYYRTGQKALGFNRPENVSVSGGSMRIALRKETYGGADYTCGGVISKKTFGYGYYETRAKLWGDQGWHSSFWLCGLSLTSAGAQGDGYGGPDNLINEIDGFEVDSGAPSTVASNTHYYEPSHVDWGGPTYTGVNTADGYHTYGWEWTPTAVKFYVDGVLTGTKAYPGPHGLQNLWLTSLAYTAPIDETNLPGEVAYDYFRYYRPIDHRDTVSTDAVVVGNGDAGYVESGDWSTADTAFGYDDKQTRYTNAVGALATWTPQLAGAARASKARQAADVQLPARPYEVLVWNPSFYNNSNTRALYTVVHDGGTSTVRVNQVDAGQQWVSLGAYRLRPDSGHNVSVVNDGTGTGPLRTGAAMFVPAVVVDNGDAGYTETGTWYTSGITGWRGTGTRYSNDTSASARWTPDLPKTGDYDVYAWIPYNSNNATGARYTIVHDGVTDTIDPDGRLGGDRWIRLGNFRFAEGSSGYVSLDKAGSPGFIRGDAVKFVPASPDDAVAPAAPTGLTATAQLFPDSGDAQLTWHWDGVDEDDVIGYHAYLDGVRVTWNPVKGDQFTVSRMRAGQSYTLTVTAVDRSGNESQTSAPLEFQMPDDTTAPGAVTGLVAEGINSRIALRWDENPALDTDVYRIHVDGVQVAATSTRAYTVPDLQNDRTYTIGVSTVDVYGNESAPTTVTATPADIALVDNTDPGYSEVAGSWTGSSVSGWMGSSTRTSRDTTATAGWHPDLGASGGYDVYAWVPNHSNATTQAKYTVGHTAGTADVLIDQTTGGNQWILLGRYQFDAGASGYVQVTNNAGAGYLRTDAVKFVPAG